MVKNYLKLSIKMGLKMSKKPKNKKLISYNYV